MIAENYDGKLPLYEHYWCIKVPHHGTQGHYFDFSQYEPENMLISNGIHLPTARKSQKNSVLRRSMEACFISRILICTVQIVTAATVTRTDVPVRRRMLSLLFITKIYKAVYFARIRLP